MVRTALKRIGQSGVLLASLILALPALADWELNMPKGVTDMSQEIYSLHMIIFIVCVVIGILVFGVMIYSIIKHRKSVHPEPATFTHSTTAEVAWTTIPIIILVVMAFPAAKVLVDIEDATNSDLTVQVTGYQWNWHYEYPAEEIAFYSKLDKASNIARQVDSGIDVYEVPHYLRNVDHPMVVPVNKKVRILLTANDVIHAWWVPELGGKKDAVPGFVNTMWFKAKEVGTYRGQCAELCGRDHGFMPIVVEVVSDSDYAAWVQSQRIEAGVTDEVAQPLSASIKTTENMSSEPVATEVQVAEPAETQNLMEAVESDTSSGAVASIAADTNTSAPAGDMDKAALMEKGEKVYLQYCSACHQASGAGLPPAFPALTGGAITTGPKEGHINNVLNGQPGTAMVAFAGQLSDEDIAAVVTYERNALGNDVGDVVTPADVAALRGK